MSTKLRHRIPGRPSWRQIWNRLDDWHLGNANPVLYRPRRDWLPEVSGEGLLTNLRRRMATVQAAHQRRRRLEHELAQYTSAADRREIETILERYPAD